VQRKAIVFGSGAREHALSQRLDDEGWSVVVAPGNAGIARRLRWAAVSLADIQACVALARAEGADLAVVGPEAPLIAGLADDLRKEGIATFGPSAAAARIEGSKAFAKDVMLSAGVPTARYQVFTDSGKALAFVRALDGKVAVKADGIAAGKGVVVCADAHEAERSLASFVDQGSLGAAGRTVVVEERISGPEVSLFAMCHGRDAHVLPLSHDYKRLKDGDQGPNTGGMGSVAPSPRASSADDLCQLAIAPVLKELERRDAPFNGLLYAGIMLTPDGPRVLEYNCRFGDPETQVVLPILRGKLGDALLAVANGRVGDVALEANGQSAIGVVLASAGYPEAPRLNDVIEGWDEAEKAGALVFGAGVGSRQGRLVTSGGRVATVVGTGSDPASARSLAYFAADRLKFSGRQLRRDVGLQEAAR
jgi:phosphoribosylamine--glycine ligase